MIDIDMGNGDTVQAELYRFPIAGCCPNIDYSQCINIAVVEYGKSLEEKIMILFGFHESHEERVEKLTEFLDEYIAKWSALCRFHPF